MLKAHISRSMIDPGAKLGGTKGSRERLVAITVLGKGGSEFLKLLATRKKRIKFRSHREVMF